MSPAVQAELDRVRDAAEYAASHPAPGGIKIATIRGYVRSKGRWYVEALEDDNPEPLALDGLTLIQKVEEAKLRDGFSAGVQDAEFPSDHSTGSYEARISRSGVAVTVSPPENESPGGHPVPSGQDTEDAT